MTKRRYLPKYVSVFTDAWGKDRYRYRRKGFPSVYLPGPLGSDEFLRALAAAGQGASIIAPKAAPGSIDELITSYCAVPSRLGPSDVTRQKVRAVLDDFRAEHGHRMVADTQFQHIEAILAAKAEKAVKQTPKGPREVGGIHAARKLRKELVRLFDFAVKLEQLKQNPAAIAERVKSTDADRTGGFHTWTEDEIAQFQARHALGTKARLAMELMLWTSLRRGDAIRLGPQHVRDGHVSLSTKKTGKAQSLPVAPQLRAAIEAMPVKGALCFLVTEAGAPFSKKGFGNWFRRRCNEAGLTHCSAHGLRKAMLRRLAELGQSNQALKAVSGHSRDDMVALYTREADQKRLAGDAIGALSAAQMSKAVSGNV